MNLKNRLFPIAFWLTPVILFSSLFAGVNSLPKFFGLSLRSNPWLPLGVIPLLFLFLKMKSRWGRYLALVILCFLIGLPLFSVWSTGWSDGGMVMGGFLPVSDASGYLASAERLDHGLILDVWSSRRPLFHVFLAVVLFVSGGSLLISLALLALICVWAFYFSMESVLEILGPGAAAAFVVVQFIFYRRFIGTTLSENLGIVLGSLSLALFLKAIRERNRSMLFAGGFLLSLGLNARAGCFFILPMIVLWAPFVFASKSRLKAKTVLMLLLVGAILLGFIINSALLAFLGNPDRASAFSNFSNSLYGMVFGGDWTSASNNPAYRGLSEKDMARRIYQDTIRAIKADPGVLLKGLLRAWREFFSEYPFSFVQHHRFIQFLSWLAVLSLVLAFIDKNAIARFLAACAAGIILSVPFVPPWDADMMRAYATTIPYIVLLPCYGLSRCADLVRKWPVAKSFRRKPPYLPERKNLARGTSPLAVFSLVIVLACFPSPIIIQKIKGGLSLPSASDIGILSETDRSVTFRLISSPGNFLKLVPDNFSSARPPSVRLSDFHFLTIYRLFRLYPEFAKTLSTLRADMSLGFDSFLHQWLIVRTEALKKGAVFVGKKVRVKDFDLIFAESQGTSLRLATRPWLVSTGEYGGSGPPGKARGPGRRRLPEESIPKKETGRR